jgi:hypothetical protein
MTPERKEHCKTEVQRACHDKVFVTHCTYLTSGLVLTVVFIVLLGAVGAELSSVFSPLAMYGQELSDLIRRMSK